MASDTEPLNLHDNTVSSPQSQIKLQLTTRHSEISLPENTGPILVNTNLRRYALSTLVNTLLQSEKPIPLEFLINGAFLRTSIDEFLTSNGISSEITLTVEYIRAIVPPIHLASFEHDDWVSAVDVLSITSAAKKWAGSTGVGPPGHERILSASYDGFLRVWNMSSEVLATSSLTTTGGPSSMKTAKFMSPSHIVSAGLDRTVRIWKYAEDPEGFSATLTPHLELFGHKASIDSLAVHHPSSKVLSASADHTLGIWSSKKSESPAAPESLLPSYLPRASNKRRKLTPTTPTLNPTPQRGPLAVLKAHSAPVSDVIFAPHDHTIAHSTSWDHSLLTWDLPTQTALDARHTSYTLLSLAALPTLNLLAAGSSARHITLIDPRASATTVTAMTLRGHTNAVVSMAPDPNSAYGLLSGSHDGTCRVWDVRASRADKGGRVAGSVFVVESALEGGGAGREREKEMVFGVGWDAEVGIVCAGKDRRVRVHRGAGLGAGAGASAG